MTNYTRLTGKVFGSSATATGDDPEIGQFGSALAGTYNGTTDVATIQSLPAWQKGFIGCVTPNTQFPPLPEMTGVGKVLSYQICYLLQKGIPAWDSGTTYYTNDWCAYNGKLYISKTDENLNNLPTNTTYWDKFTGGFSRNYGEIVTSSLPLTDSTLHLADGSLLSQQNYPDFVSYVANLYNSLPSGEFSQATQNATLGNNNWTGIAYGNGIYVAVNKSGYVSTSTNGSTWTTPTIISNQLSGLDFGGITFNGSSFALLASGYAFCTSTDGITWNITSLPSDLGNSTYNIAYGNNRYIIANTIGSEQPLTSTNGTTWSNMGSSGATLGPVNVAFINGSFYLIDNNGYLYKWSGTAWSFIGSIPDGFYCDILGYDGIQFIAMGGSGKVSVSPDGANWNIPYSDTHLGNNSWVAFTNNGLKTVALSSTGYISIKEQPSTEVFTTEADWQTSYTTYGECGKYVYNSSNNTVRIPLYNSYFTNTVNPQKLGDLTEASLPNIKGAFNHETTGGFANGAFAIGPSVAGKSSEPGGTTDHEIDFNAGYYNSIYKDSATTVNTQSIKQLVYIVVAK